MKKNTKIKSISILSATAILLVSGVISSACNKTQDKETETTKLKEQTRNIKPNLKLSIKQDNILPSEINSSNFYVDNLDKEISFEISNIIADDVNGNVIINYYFTKSIIDSKTKQPLLIKSNMFSQKYTGFKALVAPLNSSIEQVNLEINEFNKKDFLPSQYIKLQSNFSFKNIDSQYELKTEYIANDEQGKIEVKYYYVQKDKDIKSKIISKTFYGFNSLNNIANMQKEANTLNKLGNEISLKLKKQINKSETYASTLNWSDFETSKKLNSAYLRSNGELIFDDINGEVKLNYYFEKQYIDKKTGASYWIKSKVYTTKITGFKSFLKNLNIAVDKVNLSINEKNINTILPSQYIQNLSNFKFDNLNNEYELQKKFSYDDQKGELTISYWYNDNKKNLKSNIVTKKFVGFNTLLNIERQETSKKLSNLVNSIDLNEFLAPEKHNKKPSEIKNIDFNKKNIDGAMLVIEKMQANDEEGTLLISFYLKSTNPKFSDLKTEIKTVKLTDFLTNAQFINNQRNETIAYLNELIGNLNIKVSDKKPETAIKRFASSIKQSDLNIEILKPNNHSKNIEVVVKQLIPNDESGKLSIRLAIKQLNKQINEYCESSKLIEVELSGYKTKTMDKNEKIESLNKVAKETTTLRLISSKNIAKTFASDVQKNDFETKISNDFYIEILEISESNDDIGSLKIKFVVKTKEEQYKDLKSNEQTITLTGFYTKEQYLKVCKQELNKLISDDKIEANVVFDKENDKSNILPSNVEGKEIHLNISDSKYTIEGNPSIIADDDQGILSISWTIKVKEEKFKTFIVSESRISKKITNFLTKKQNEINIEQKRLDTLVEQENIISLKNNEYSTSKKSSMISKNDFELNKQKSNELAGLELSISKISPNASGKLEITFSLLNKTFKHGAKESSKRTVTFNFLSDENYAFNLINNLSISKESTYVTDGVYTIADFNNKIANNKQEIAKLLGISDFLNQNSIIELNQENENAVVSLNKFVNTTTVKYEFILKIKSTNDKLFKKFSGEISIANIMNKRNLKNFANNFDFDFKDDTKKELAKSMTIDESIEKDYNFFFREKINFGSGEESYIIDDLKIQKDYKLLASENANDINIQITFKLDDYSEIKTFTKSGFNDKASIEKIKEELKNEPKRLDDLLDKLTMEFTKNNDFEKRSIDVKDITIQDYRFNLKDSDSAAIYEIEAVKYDKTLGKLTYKIKLKSNKSLLNEYSQNPIESTKSRTFEFYGFAKDVSEITKNLESDVKKSNEFKKYLENVKLNIETNIEKKINEARKKQHKKAAHANVIKAIIEQYKKFNEEIEKTLFELANKAINVFGQFNSNKESIKKLYNILINLIINTNDEMLNVLLELGIDDKVSNGRGFTYYKNLTADWVLSKTVGAWAIKMFKEFKNGTDVFIEYLTPILNSFKEKHEFLKTNDSKYNELKSLLIKHLEYILDYFCNLKFDYLFQNSGPKQTEYDNKGGGKKVLILFGGWPILFDVEKFIEPKYSDPSGKDLKKKLNDMVNSNKITKQEYEIIFNEFKGIILIFKQLITNIYSKDLKNVLTSQLPKVFKTINNAKKSAK
ncbi:lipoprotein 17-related variable surface protein [Metamycoplasma hominis]|uniref:lipoprotein 17-related variable surface protein n=1 Tax=Metamycoplasma hominis TaxID=2098 RepID=UPI00066C7076|nr:lipoprotein 17-related variable surface protein [Metamycoplasma hominis]